jgi:hypothetical protein
MTVAMAQTRAGMGMPSVCVFDMKAAEGIAVARLNVVTRGVTQMRERKASSCPKSPKGAVIPRRALCLKGFVNAPTVLSGEINVPSDKTMV